MGEKVDVLNFVESQAGTEEAALEVIRLDDSETAVIPFTAESEKVAIHYCGEAEIRGYAHCNGETCVVCKIGRKRAIRLLIPVYDPVSRGVGVLPVSDSLRPNALLPQLVEILKVGHPVVVFIKREGSKYTLSTRDLAAGIDDGAASIADFKAGYEKGKLKLESVYLHLSDEQLAGVPEIGQMLKLKGIDV